MAEEKKPAHEVILDLLQESNDSVSQSGQNPMIKGYVHGLTATLCRMIIPENAKEGIITKLRQMKALFNEAAVDRMIELMNEGK